MYNITVDLIYRITLVSRKQLCCNVLNNLAVLHRGKGGYFSLSGNINTTKQSFNRNMLISLISNKQNKKLKRGDNALECIFFFRKQRDFNTLVKYVNKT